VAMDLSKEALKVTEFVKHLHVWMAVSSNKMKTPVQINLQSS
jgi:hypothetical protein